MWMLIVAMALLFPIISAPAVQPAPLEVNGAAATQVAADPVTGIAHYTATDRALFTIDDAGGWTKSGMAPEAETIIVDSSGSDTLWAGTGQECYRGGGTSQPLIRSDDAGATWAEVGPAGFVPLASWASANIVLAENCTGLQVSADGGETWRMPEGLPQGSQVTAFAVASGPEADEGLVVLIGITGEGGTSQLYRVDLHDPASPVAKALDQSWFAFAPLAVTKSGDILLGAAQGVLRSGDGGESWTLLRDGLESTTLDQDPLVSFPNNTEPGSFGLGALLTTDEDIYVSGVDGVYHLASDADAWQKIAVLDGEVIQLAASPDGKTLLVAVAEGEVLTLGIA